MNYLSASSDVESTSGSTLEVPKRSRSFNLRRKKETGLRSRSRIKHERSTLGCLIQNTLQMDGGPISIAVRPPSPSETPNNDDDDVSFGFKRTAASAEAAIMLCFITGGGTGGNSNNELNAPREKIRRKSYETSSSTAKVKSKCKHILNKSRSTNSVSFGLRSASGYPMAPLIGQSIETQEQNVININSINDKIPSHLNNNNNNNQLQSNNLITTANTGNTKLETKSHKQSSSSPSPLPSVSSSSSLLTGTNQQQLSPKQHQDKRSGSPHPLKSNSQTSVTDSTGKSSQTLTTTVKNDIPEKEKKRKELSSSRQKKFHRHFQQVDNEENVINYFSCALVSDILLQGHLYITENYFAFYSNVFGFVTKLLIPTSSVIKISKEKTAKIIPNAVGVATIDERHVFGSFMSREAAFRLMCSVCQPLEPIEVIPKVPDTEEYIEDDSSCSISGNESPPQAIVDTNSAITNTNENISTDTSQLRNRSIPAVAAISFDEVDGPKLVIAATATLESPCSTNSPIKTQKKIEQLPAASNENKLNLSSFIKFKYPQDFHIVYLGIVLTILLSIMSGFLMYKILDIEAKSDYRNLDFSKWTSNSNDDVYLWQKELQRRSSEEAQNFLAKNLEQIAKVRESLEALSKLIHKNPEESDDGIP